VTGPGLGDAPSGHVAHICRHPVKSVGYEEIDSTRLSPGATLPGDRRWAVAHAAADLPEELAEWAPKRNFLRGVAAPDLMAIRAQTGVEGNAMTLSHPRAGTITVDPSAPCDAARLIDWLAPMWPEGRPAPSRIVSRRDGALTDRPEPFVSILNPASNRALGERLGHELSIHRWRGNLWLDGLAPWEEFDLLDREIAIGPARLKVIRRITRCKATTANPETGRIDADTLGALEDAYGHHDFGVYATVLEGGEIRCGDRMQLT